MGLLSGARILASAPCLLCLDGLAQMQTTLTHMSVYEPTVATADTRPMNKVAKFLRIICASNKNKEKPTSWASQDRIEIPEKVDGRQLEELDAERLTQHSTFS